jgi:hypothetical protein
MIAAMLVSATFHATGVTTAPLLLRPDSAAQPVAAARRADSRLNGPDSRARES